MTASLTVDTHALTDEAEKLREALDFTMGRFLSVLNEKLPAVYRDVHAERLRAHAKHGETSMESAPADDPTGRRLRILVEEIGEVAMEFNDAEHDQRPVDLTALRKELIQVAAMAAAWADAIDGNTL